MAQEERYGNRSLTYSAWHRRISTGRYIGIENAQRLAMIDMDHVLWVEYEDDTKEPIALVEEAQDVNQSFKSSTITTNLARRASLPALLVLWTTNGAPNPAAPEYDDIVSFRIRRLYPNLERGWRIMTPLEYANTLLTMRDWQTNRLDIELFDGVPAF